MSGPCCGDGCKYFYRALLGDQQQGECMDPAKIIYYKYGNAVNPRPSVDENMTCGNWTAEDGKEPRK